MQYAIFFSNGSFDKMLWFINLFLVAAHNAQKNTFHIFPELYKWKI